MGRNLTFICGHAWEELDEVDGRQKKPKAALAEKYRSSTWFIVFAVMMATFTDMFIYSAIVPVAPFALPIRAGIPVGDVQHWIPILLAVSNVVNIFASLPCGWISDRLGIRMPLFVVGTIFQFSGLALMTTGNSIALWVGGRALQGVASAIVLTTTLPLLLESAPKQQSGRYLGLFGLSASLGLVMGPPLGGAIYDQCGHYAVFALFFALNLVDFAARLLIIEKKNISITSSAAQVVEVEAGQGCNNSTKFELTKVDLTKSQVELIDSESETEANLKKPKPTILAYLRSRSVIIELLCSPRMLAALYGGLLYTAMQTAFDATLTLFVKETFGWNSLGAGLIFIPLLVTDFCGPIFGWVADRYGARMTCTAGFLFGTAPFVCLRFVNHNTIEHKVLLCALLAAIGFALAAILPAATAEVGKVIDEKGLLSTSDSGDTGAVARAYSLFNIAFAGGCLLGPLWAGPIKEHFGWATMSWTLALLWTSGVVPVLLWLH